MNGPIVAGALANNVWSFGGTHGPGGNSYNAFLTQPFFNYNFGGGWYVGTSPIITADWQANGTIWTVPIGAQAGRVIRIGKLPVNLLLGAYYNIVKPQYGRRLAAALASRADLLAKSVRAKLRRTNIFLPFRKCRRIIRFFGMSDMRSSEGP